MQRVEVYLLPNWLIHLGSLTSPEKLSRLPLSPESCTNGNRFRPSTVYGLYWVLQCGWRTKRPSSLLSSRPWPKAISSSVTRIGGP